MKRPSIYKHAASSPFKLIVLLSLLAVVNIFVRFGILSQELLWDKTLADSKTAILASNLSLMILAFFIGMILFHILPAIRKKDLSGKDSFFAVCLIAYFLLELIGCVFASSMLYRLLGGCTYLAGMILSVHFYSLIKMMRTPQAQKLIQKTSRRVKPMRKTQHA